MADVEWQAIEAFVRRMCEIARTEPFIVAQSRIGGMMPKMREICEKPLSEYWGHVGVEDFPSERIKRIPVNLPFERVPQCACDPGVGEPPPWPCPKCGDGAPKSHEN